MSQLILGIGSNLGNRLQNLEDALFYIKARIGKILQCSSVYETPAWGFAGKDFFNAVVSVETNYNPKEILLKLQEIERLIGRKEKSRNQHYKDRPIDIDILFYDDIVLNLNDLTIPHKLLHERNFVLFPLVEILPEYFHPVFKKTSKDLVNLSPKKNIPKIRKEKLEIKQETGYNFIAIEGNIGAGKTTFSTQFAQDFNAKLVLERFEENPFLPKFYKNPKRYAFPLEMSFLADRYQQLSDDLAQYDLFKTSVISDYFVFKSLIFSKVTLSEEEYGLYRKLFNFMYKDLVKPDLYIYLYQNVERLLANIKKRGRDYEQQIKGEYLEQIHEGYMNFIKTQKDLNVLILDISDIDFVKNPVYYHKMLKIITNHKETDDKYRIVKVE